MMMLRKIFLSFFCFSPFLTFAAQLPLTRVEKMPDFPTPYLMRDWKAVARGYDNFVFDLDKEGQYLPLARVTQGGNNYPDINPLYLDTYVGSKTHGRQSEAINVIPAVVGATLVGIDKSNQNGNDWVLKMKEYFNCKNGQHVYLNGFSTTSGGDWWYDVMPNIYFYQLYSLYPNKQTAFDNQLLTIADRWLGAVYALGGSASPWTKPNMNYRAFNLATGKPLLGGVIEPESAGSIAWLLWQAYCQSGESKYKVGAELALDFLNDLLKNPSYELQLPYGVLVAARMNAEEGTNYDIQKMLNWCFDRGALRGWGAIVGKWGDYDVSGLIGEANDNGNDYAFIMNGFQQAAALAPVAKYDKRFAAAIAKWILNLSNASRLFYPNALPVALQEEASHNWSVLQDLQAVIPFESMKEKWQGKSPFAMGDATRGGWAETNLSLYSGSSVGYLAAIIEQTDQEGILQIDLNKTDFFVQDTPATYLYYNPHSSLRAVTIALSHQAVDLYDLITERYVARNVTTRFQFEIPPHEVRMLVVLPADAPLKVSGRLLKVGDRVIDYHCGYNYKTMLRSKSIAIDKKIPQIGETVTVAFTADNIPLGASLACEWQVNNQLVAGKGTPLFTYKFSQAGTYTIKVKALARGEVTTDSLTISVVDKRYDKPQITNLQIDHPLPLITRSEVILSATVVDESPEGSVSFTVNGGELLPLSKTTQRWVLPAEEGVYTATCTASNLFGESIVTHDVLVRSETEPILSPLFYYNFNHTFTNWDPFTYPLVVSGTSFVTDSQNRENNALYFENADQYLYLSNDPTLNFTDKLTLSCWFKPVTIGKNEQFILSHGSWEERYKLSITPEKKLRWTVKTAQGVKDIDYSLPLQNNQYYHVTALYTGYSIELYVGGVLVAFAPLRGELGITTKDLTFSRKDRAENLYSFVGSIDEVRLYNQILSPTQIAQLPTIWEKDVTAIDPVQQDDKEVIIRCNNHTLSIINNGSAQMELISLYNAQGILIQQKHCLSFQNEMHFYLSNDVEGLFLVTITLDNGQKMVKKVIF